MHLRRSLFCSVWSKLTRRSKRTRLCYCRGAPISCTTRSWWPPWPQAALMLCWLTLSFLAALSWPGIWLFLLCSSWMHCRAVWTLRVPSALAHRPTCPGLCHLTQIAWPFCSGWRTCSLPWQRTLCAMWFIHHMGNWLRKSFRKMWLSRTLWALHLSGFSERTLWHLPPGPSCPIWFLLVGSTALTKNHYLRCVIWLGTLQPISSQVHTLGRWTCHR